MILVIVGPTGVGKTKLSIELAKKFNGEIINGDSTQIYKEINIGTAKVTLEERGNIYHHLIDIKNLNKEYSIYDYQNDARNILKDILKKNKTPIIVGGSGLYLKALLYNYEFNLENKEIDLNVSNTKMIEQLTKKNIEVDKNNIQRVKRSYIKYVINNEDLKTKENELIFDDVYFIGLNCPRDILYERINYRVDQMLENGLVEEVKSLLNRYPSSKQLKNTIGYKEIIAYLNEEISFNEAINLIKQHSRNYAKRQYTWLKNKMNVVWFEVDFINFNNTVNEIIEYLKKSN